MGEKSYEILNGLPPYGPMWFPIGNPKLTTEGFVVRFYRDDGSSWVGNFDLGHGSLDFVEKLSFDNLLLVISQGAAYLINPNYEKEVKSLGFDFNKIITDESNRVILVGSTDITIIELTGDLWTSDSISYDGIEVERVENDIIHGKVFSMEDTEIDFTLNLNSKKLNGGHFSETKNKKTFTHRLKRK